MLTPLSYAKDGVMIVLRPALKCVLFGLLLLTPVWAQDSCPQLAIPQVVPGTNIFSEKQQVYLGGAIDASMRLDLVIINDPEVTARTQSIVDRLAEPLPSP